MVLVMRESQQIATEHRGDATHAHRAGAERHGKEDHLSGHESSRQALEHSNHAYLQAQKEHTSDAVNDQDIAALAYALWQGRGCPEGSPEKDWHRAVEQLRSRH